MVIGYWSVCFIIYFEGLVGGGVVCGFSEQEEYSRLFYRDGVMMDLKNLGGTYSWGFGINESTRITGYSFVNNLSCVYGRCIRRH